MINEEIKKQQEQLDVINKFCLCSDYYLVRYGDSFGKILANEELSTINLAENEIRRSIKNKNDSMLFVYTIETEGEEYVLNPLQLLLNLKLNILLELLKLLYLLFLLILVFLMLFF